jgi:hypothetical protein
MITDTATIPPEAPLLFLTDRGGRGPPGADKKITKANQR